jgi:hypothetical protein
VVSEPYSATFDKGFIVKRDMDLIRKILLQIEERGPNESGIEIDIPDVELTTVGAHTRLLSEAGFIAGIPCDDFSGAGLIPTRLTWAGHDFLDAARNDTIWGKAKAKLAEVGIGVSMEVMKATLIALAKEKLNLS